MPTIGYQPNPGNSRLSLDLTEPNKTEDTWEITVTAIVSDDGKPTPGVQVQLYHNGRLVDSPYFTDGEGRTEPKTFSDLEKGSHTFEATIIGTSIKARRTVKLKDEKPKKVAKLIVRNTFDSTPGIIVQVLTSEDTPVQNAAVFILNGGKRTDMPRTDKNGETTQTINLNPNQRVCLRICVAGSNVETINNIFPRS